MKKFPGKDAACPNTAIPSLCFIKNVVKNPRNIIGDYTYYDDVDGAGRFEEHVTHFYEFFGDRLIIDIYCAIARGVTFVMNGAMPGVHIGNGAIIGTNVTVASGIPPYAIAVGNRARVIQRRFDDETIPLLRRLQWWNPTVEEVDALIPVLSNPDIAAMKRDVEAYLAARENNS